MPSYLQPPSAHQPPSLSGHPPITSDSAGALPRLASPIDVQALNNHNRQPVYQHQASDRGQQVVFTRQLWRRSMPNESTDASVSRGADSTLTSTETSIANTSHSTLDIRSSRRASSSVSSRSLRQPPSSPSGGSRTPLTPEESPPFRTTRKRAISTLEDEDRTLGSAEPSPSHTRKQSSESNTQVCICQPDPKIPRPRNAFILYRQHHQAKVIADHPGLANPEISKIIGEQWRNQPAEVKNEWKRLAEEEKIRHQQQYPQYRYQPKRNTRRNSLTDTPTSSTGERARCQKCGGRTVVAPGSYTNNARESSPTGSALRGQTPTSLVTPTSRTLPVLRDLTIDSPGSRRMIRPYHPAEMSPRHPEADDLAAMSPDTKRRRFNAEYPVTMYRALPPRYAVAPIGTAVSPGSHHGHVQQHPYTPSQIAHARRESLPSLHMMSPTGPMGPPPRPGMGYQQHRLSQGHAAPDRSLTLPPLQTGGVSVSTPATKSSDSAKTAKDVIMSLPLNSKMEVLRQIAPPAPFEKDHLRGPLIAIEGDDVEAVKSLANRLADMLNKEDDTVARLIDAPTLHAEGSVEDAMAEYHLLAATWLRRSKELMKELDCSSAATAPPTTASVDMVDAPVLETKIEKDADLPTASSGDDGASRMSIDAESDHARAQAGTDEATPPRTSDIQSTPPAITAQETKRPVLIVPTFSLRATNFYACRIPILDAYGPKEHWQWNATLWRGIIGPDLTIYLRDAEESDQRKAVEQSESERLFMVKRIVAGGQGTVDIDSATLRRVGFEISEWIRAFGPRGA